MKNIALIILALATALPAWAETRVTGVQSPAWVERNGARTPIGPGVLLQQGDRVLTGPGGRVHVQLPEGSTVKLGAGAQLNVDQLNDSNGQQSLFQSSLNVLRGAFRFTTSAIGKLRQRDVSIRVASVTAGIRGTDLWGRSNDEKDLVCLLEGKIAVRHDSGVAADMNEPLQFFVAPKNAAPLPVGRVDPEQVKQWAMETEMAEGQGVLDGRGPWKLQVASGLKQAQALAWYDRLREAGYPARLQPAQGRYAVLIKGFATELDARSAGLSLQQNLQVPKVVIMR